MASKTGCLIASVAIACLGAATTVDTQTSSPDVTTALLTEVRALRTTIALVVAAGASGQLTLGRLQLQEQRVNALMARLDTARERLAESRREVIDHRENCKSIERALTNPSAGPPFAGDYAPSRESLESTLTRCRAEIAFAAAETDRLTTEEAGLAADLSAEQSRWSDLNRRLTEIELALGRSQ